MLDDGQTLSRGFFAASQPSDWKISNQQERKRTGFHVKLERDANTANSNCNFNLSHSSGLK
jgi:hypothetical protein